MALWCSRLARQPVTLEVDGSSPFGVAKKETTHLGGFFFAISIRTRTIKCNADERCSRGLDRAKL